MSHFKPAALAALLALIADSAFAQSQGQAIDTSDANDVIVLGFNDGDYADLDMILDEQVTYEFQSLDYDTCTRTYILAESDSNLYEWGLGTTNYNVLEQVTDEGAYQYTFTGLESDGIAFTTTFYQVCTDENGDQFYPEIHLSVTVQASDASDDSEASDDSDASDVIVLEFWDGDYANIDLTLDEQVTYEFQSPDYDNCTRTYILPEEEANPYEWGLGTNYNVLEQVTDEGAYQYTFTGLESDGRAFKTTFYQVCTDENGDRFYPEIHLSVTVQASDASDDSEASDDSDASDVIVLEFWDGDYANIDLTLDESVTYEFQSLDYDTCTSSYFKYQTIDDAGLYDFGGYVSFNVLEQIMDEGVYQFVFTGVEADGIAYIINLAQECTDANGDLVEIRFNLFVAVY